MPTGMAFALLVSTPFLTQIGWRGLWIAMFLLAPIADWALVGA